MKTFEGYLICSDFDNTLRGSDQLVSAENARAIRYFQENGGLFTMATGRHASALDEFKNTFVANTYLITMNGSMLYDPQEDKTILRRPLDSAAEEVLEYVVKTYGDVQQIRVHDEHDIAHYFPGMTFAELKREMVAKLKTPLYKMVFISNAEACLQLKEDMLKRFGDRYNFDRSWPDGLELHSKDSGKGICLSLVKDLLQGKVHTTIGVGDYENDITLLQAADIGYAVSNAADSVKAVADRVTVSNDENAIAKIIETIEAEVEHHGNTLGK